METMTQYEADNLVAALREHRNSLARDLDRSEDENRALLSKVAALEIQVDQLKMKDEEHEQLVKHYMALLYNLEEYPSGIAGEPQ